MTTAIATLHLLTLCPDNYRYLVTTNLAGVIPNLNRMMTVVELPRKFSERSTF